MIPFRDELRYLYPLTEKGVVMDIGVYEGQWTAEMRRLYDCEVFAFEPVPEFFSALQERFAGDPKVHLYNFGVGGLNRLERWKWKGSMTGIASKGDNEIEVLIEDIVDVLKRPELQRQIDVVKINIEGGEYDLLEYLIGRQQQFTNIQIQWHSVVDNCEARRKRISDALSLTHELTWQAPEFDCGHENWALKT